MKLTKFDYWFLAGIFLLNLALKLFRLNSPAEVYFDEGAAYIPAARGYLQGNFDLNFEHPPLAKLFMSLGILVFGDNPWGWRIPEVLVGSLGVVFIYLLAKRLFGGNFTPILASLFLTFEFSWFVNSRIGTIEIYLATFSLAASFFFWNFFKEEKLKYSTLAGIFFGLAIAAKWSGVFLLIFLGIYYLWYKRKKLTGAFIRFTTTVLITALVCLGSYGFYLTAHSFTNLANLQIKMAKYHLQEVPKKEKARSVRGVGSTYSYLQVYHPSLWVFNPIFPYYGESIGERVKSVLFLFNPALFWGSLAVILISLKRLTKEKEKLFLVVAFTSFWLPWLFSPRFSLSYYLLGVMPFGILLLVKLIREKFKEWNFFITGFVVSVIALFFFYYPLLTAVSVHRWYFRILTGTAGLGP